MVLSACTLRFYWFCSPAPAAHLCVELLLCPFSRSCRPGDRSCTASCIVSILDLALCFAHAALVCVCSVCVCVCVRTRAQMCFPNQFVHSANHDTVRSGDSSAPPLLPSCQAHASADQCTVGQPAVIEAAVHAFSSAHGHEVHSKVHINVCPAVPNYSITTSCFPQLQSKLSRARVF